MRNEKRNMNSVLLTLLERVKESEAVSRFLLVLGTIFLAVSIVIWVFVGLSTYAPFNSIAFIQTLATKLPYVYILFIISLGLLHASLALNKGVKETSVFLIQSNLLSSIGITSLPFHLSTWVFIFPGLIMAFFAYYVLRIPSARTTQFFWGNGLIAVGAYLTTFNIPFVQEIAGGVQITGLALIALTVYAPPKDLKNKIHTLFDKWALILLSLWSWVLGISTIYWFLIAQQPVYGATWLMEGIALAVSNQIVYKGIWPVVTPSWTRQLT